MTESCVARENRIAFFGLFGVVTVLVGLFLDSETFS